MEAVSKSKKTPDKTAAKLLKERVAAYHDVVGKISALNEKDKWGASPNLSHELQLIGKAKALLQKQPNQLAPTFTSRPSCEGNTQQSLEKAPSFVSQRSRTRSGTSRTSSSSRREAKAELAAAQTQAEYDRLIAEKENERRKREAEERKRKEEEEARYQLDMALLAADRTRAIASARLEAIEKCMQDEDEESEDGEASPSEDDLLAGLEEKQRREEPQANVKNWIDTSPDQPIAASTPAFITNQNLTTEMLGTFTITNQRLVSGLTKQILPKCNPTYLKLR